MKLTIDTLKPFQIKAASEIAEMIATYPNPPYKRRFDPETGMSLPFLCRLKAITGSGKTPILSLACNKIGDGIILWTTNRGAVISQTKNNLSVGGKYSNLLPDDVNILNLNEITETDWVDICRAKKGLTIILATVALFNRDGDALNVHKDRDGISHWDVLSGKGPEGRNRQLYVVYDEAHGGTKAQFSRLKELNPRAFILASSSEMSGDLIDLLPGNNVDEKSLSLKTQTVVVSTPLVVKEGLLKTRLYLVDCNTSRLDALTEANTKWQELSTKMSSFNTWPVICCIVNSTLAGLEVWESLVTQLKVDPKRIAVHLANVNSNLANVNPNAPWSLLVDTHKAKKSPEDLHDEGYSHIIWNLSLREGWDEPWAYVAYLDGLGKSTTDISQKIGRFLRQPNATPFDDGDLNSAYFYFNVPDKDFSELVKTTQNDLSDSGHEIVSIESNSPRPQTSREVPVKKEVFVSKVAETFGEDLEILDQILLSNVPLFSDESLRSKGKMHTRVLDLANSCEDLDLNKEETKDDNADISVWEYLVSRLGTYDNRIARKSGTCFTPFVKNDPKMKQRMQFGSDAMLQINNNLSNIIRLLNNEFHLEYEYDDIYAVKSFNLVSPDYQYEDLNKRNRYKVNSFKNALHSEYNGLNKFELEIAESIDSLGVDWCRNPSKTGYNIPIPEIGQGTSNFFPDFLLWGKNQVWALDPKGSHLINDAIFLKLMAVSDINDKRLRLKVGFVLEGEYMLGINNRPQLQSKNGCTLIYKKNSSIRAKSYPTSKELIKDLLVL
ncbi:TPA: DEAD/DEAH box helicase family protein [Klebsiella pneumoniae]